MNKKYFFILLFGLGTLCAQAQNSLMDAKNGEYKPFRHLEVNASVGTLGFGLNLAAPINQHLAVRAGVNVVPQLSITKSFAMSGVKPGADINRLVDYLDRTVNPDPKTIGGKPNPNYAPVVDNMVDMQAKVSAVEARVLLDWYPFHKKNWHFTAGFFVGSTQLGKVNNLETEAYTMVAAKNYNKLYDDNKWILEMDPDDREGVKPTVTIGGFDMAITGSEGDQLLDILDEFGRIGLSLGTMQSGEHQGQQVYLQPGRDATTSLYGRVNPIKPYVGFGYDKTVGKDNRWKIGFDCGLLIYGRAPHIYADGYVLYDASSDSYTVVNDRICITHDVSGASGTVGDIMKLIKNMPVYPLLEFRLGYTL